MCLARYTIFEKKKKKKGESTVEGQRRAVRMLGGTENIKKG